MSRRLAAWWMTLAALSAIPAGARPPEPEPARERTPLLARWEALRYGMFIHYGLGTFTDDEYGRKNSQAADYRPTALDVDQWIRVAKRAGMRYAVLTAKHCTGHCLWPSALTDFTVANSPHTTDVVAEFVKACRKHGLQPGLYYLLGWDAVHQPGRTPAEYEAFCTGQLTELLTRYGPIQQLFLDIPFDMGPDTAGALARIYANVKRLQPDCLVLYNQGFTDGSSVAMMRPTYFYQPAGDTPVAMWPRDLIDGEVTLPPPTGHNPVMRHNGSDYYVPMEVCDTLARHWFWSPDDALNSVPTLYRLHEACRTRGANLLLDVAPDRTGRIPEGTVRQLMALKRAVDAGKAPANLLEGARATASNTYRGDAQYGPDRLTDGDPRTRWATDDGERTAWVQFDLPAPARLGSVYVSEGWGRVRSFCIDVRGPSGEWRTVARGKQIGAGRTLAFRPVTASALRLRVLDATVGPTLWDVEAYAP